MASKFKFDKHQDEATIEIIRGINHLLIKAEENNFNAISTILKEAKEDVAWWATYQNDSEHAPEKLAHQLTTEDALNIAMNFLSKFRMAKNGAMKEELLRAIELSSMEELVLV